MIVYEIDPLSDARWPRLLAHHKAASAFHSPEWLEALRRTYGYSAAALTTSPPGRELDDGLVFCRVRSWLTGKRVVSVPFSDHCTPLVDTTSQLAHLLVQLRRECSAGGGKYIEIRPAGDAQAMDGFSESARFHLHRLDLRPSLDHLYSRLHHSCIRRRLNRALREPFVYQEGRSEGLLRSFYELAVLTRRRQHLPPQPLGWFRNLIGCLGERLKIRMLFHSGHAAAGILTIDFRRTMTYKYGFSDATFHKFGSMQLLLWKAITQARQDGLVEFDMGRSDWKNEQLAQFKDRWGCERSTLSYARYPAKSTQPEKTALTKRIARRIFAMAPNIVLTAAGDILYRHLG